MILKIFSLLNCIDCKAYHLLVDEFCRNHKLPYEIVDLDIEEHMDQIIEFRVTHIPTSIFFNQDTVLCKKGGILIEEDLKALLNDATLAV